jgi:hypothetical protein
MRPRSTTRSSYCAVVLVLDAATKTILKLIETFAISSGDGWYAAILQLPAASSNALRGPKERFRAYEHWERHVVPILLPSQAAQTAQLLRPEPACMHALAFCAFDASPDDGEAVMLRLPVAPSIVLRLPEESERKPKVFTLCQFQ